MAVASSGRLYALVMLNGQTHYIGYTDDPEAISPAWTRMDLPLTPGDNLGTIGDATNSSPIVVTTPTGAISDATDADPIVITSTDHGLDSGDQVHIDGVAGNTAANGVFFISVVNSDRFRLDDSEGSGAYTGGGSWGIAHGLASGDVVEVEDVLGNTAANGLFRAEVIDPRSFALDESTGNGVYAGGGTWVEHSTLNPRFKPGAQGAIHASIVVDPGDPAVVYVGGDRQDPPFPNFIGADDFTGRLFRGDTTVSATGQVPSPQREHLTHDDDIPEIPGGGTASSSSPHADSREMVFDADGNLIEVSDGGIYRRTSPGDNNGDWFSINGDVQVTEIHDIRYDTISNVIVGGTQDNGTIRQPTPGAIAWEQSLGGDGGDVAIDTTSFPGHSIRYTSAQRLIAFRKQRVDASNDVVDTDFPSLDLLAGEPPVYQFVTPVELNSVDPERLIVGGYNSPYESFDQGESITELNPGEGVSVNWDAVVYGGRRQGVDNVNLLWVGSFDRVFLRVAASPVPLVESGAYPGGKVRDIVVDPEDWAIAYVLDDDNDRIYRTIDAGVSWVDVTGNLDDTLLTLAYMPSAVDRLVAGGVSGVSAMRVEQPGIWDPLGNGLPRAPVMELHFDPGDDLLVAATMGRGAWMLESATCTGAANDDDGDGICNGSDNCPDDPNAAQVDLDLDGFGDVCDCAPEDPAINPGTPEIADDGIDQDCNGADTVSCYTDTDQDGFGDSGGSITLAADGMCDPADGESTVAGDCNDSNASVWHLPQAARELIFTGPATVAWSPPVEIGGQPGSLRYDVIRSGEPSDFSTAASCVESNDGSDTTAVASEIPAPGDLHTYLVRPENACGEGTIGNSSLGPRPDARACAARAYVTNSANGTVSAIDLGSLSVELSIDVPGTPLGAAISTDGSRVYVTVSGATDLFDAAVIDTTTLAVAGTVPGDRFGATGAAVSPDGATVYLSRQHDASVSVVDTATNQITATLPVGTTPQFLAIKPDGSVVYVPNASSSSVSVIDTGSNTVIDTIAVGNAPYAVAFSADGATAYVSNNGSASISVIDCSTHTVTDSIQVGGSPRQLAVAPDGATLYVSTEFGEMNVVDTATATMVRSVHVSGTPDGIGITPDGSLALVASNIGYGPGGFVSVVDLATEMVIASIPANHPVSVVIAP
jgi:YVTN family beta-propeller protein